MNKETVSEGKTIAIISYITIIGLVIAFIMNQNKRNFFASFHIRQATGIALLEVIISLLSKYTNLGFISILLGIAALTFSVIGIIGAVQGQEKRIPFFGDQFQEWFKNIG